MGNSPEIMSTSPVIKRLYELTFLLLPFAANNLFRIDLGNFQIPLYYLPFPLIFITFLLRYVVSPAAAGQYRKSRIQRNFLVALEGLVVIYLVSSLWAVDFSMALSETVRLFSCFAIAFIVTLSLPKADVSRMLHLAILSSTIMLLFHLFLSLFILHAPYLSPDITKITQEGKNQMAFYLAAMTPIVIWRTLRSKSGLLVGAAPSAVHFVALIYSLSRGAWMSFLFSTMIVVLIIRRRPSRYKKRIVWRKLGIIVLLLLGGVSCYFVFTYQREDWLNLYLWQRFDLSNTYEGGSNYLRKSFIRIALDNFLNNPLLGIGTGSFEALTRFASHNSYLEILSEQGLLGFSLFMMLLWTIWQKARRVSKSYWETAGLSHSALSAMIYLLFINAFTLPFLYIIWSTLLKMDDFDSIETKGREGRQEAFGVRRIL
jgi:O-antigen ligase